VRSDVVALYVDARGPYGALGVDCWTWEADAQLLLSDRDARRYAGPAPCVAHPPCGPWGRLRHLYRGAEHDCGPRAVEQVRRFGGVLEHPAGSQLWAACGMPAPGQGADAFGGYSIEVCQVDWGHPARKRTWLYVVGTIDLPPFPAPREPTHWVSGRRGMARASDNVPPGIKVCSAQQRRRTPVAFAQWLLDVAGSVRRARGAA
jgi:hypothetical protein